MDNQSIKFFSCQMLLYVAFFFHSAVLPLSASERVALVVGNANYSGALQLRTPLNDVRDLQNPLKESMFNVELREDLTRDRFQSVTQSFVDKQIRDYNQTGYMLEAVLFYYAGHGVQYEGRNFLLPIDVAPTKESIRAHGVDLNKLIFEFNKIKASSYIFVIDACRNNPFENLELGNGLSEVEAGPNNYIVFSAKPGAVALDGEGNNSPFASAFSYQILKQGLPIESAMRETRKNVYSNTNEQQLPWDSSSLLNEFEFVPLSPFGVRELKKSINDNDKKMWTFVEQTEYSEFALRKYLLLFPNGERASEAKRRLGQEQ